MKQYMMIPCYDESGRGGEMLHNDIIPSDFLGWFVLDSDNRPAVQGLHFANHTQLSNSRCERCQKRVPQRLALCCLLLLSGVFGRARQMVVL